jgi:hypothetical protein
VSRSSRPPRARTDDAKAPSASGVARLGEKQVEALTVAMVVAPGVYARNRMFDFLSSPGAQRARTRAAVVRGVVRQLARATGLSLTSEVRGEETLFVLRYGIPAVRLTRVVELSQAELAALRLVAERAGVRALASEPEDRELVSRALARLLDDGAGAAPVGEAFRLVRDILGPE